MNKVITINLNGKAHQLEEAGYDALRKYLDEARAALRDNPDRDEVMVDFEQAVADKCDACLTGAKNVVSTKEIEEIIAKMGPVDGATGAAASTGGAADGGAKSANASDAIGDAGASNKAAAPKRLYRIIEGSRIRGVCTGIAAYFNVDVTLVRVLSILLTVFTGGGWAIAYIVLVIVLPVARTADEIAQAHGEPPFTAQDFIDRARTEYEKYKADPSYDKDEIKQRVHAWRDEWHAKRRVWRDERRETRRMAREEWRAERRERWHDSGCHGSGLGTLIGMIVSVTLTVLFVIALISLISHGIVFGHPLGMGHPLWVSLFFLISAFYIVSFPFRHMIHDEHDCHRHHGGSGFFVLLFLVLFVYTAIVLFPPVRDAWNSLIMYLQTVRT